MQHGPAVGTISFFGFIYLIVLYFLISILFNFPFLHIITGYVMVIGGVLIFIAFWVIYSNDDKMREVVHTYEAQKISKIKIWLQGLLINLLPIIIFFIVFYFKYKKSN